jgi:DNA invertase Pin-like site-specific DNA recombinase
VKSRFARNSRERQQLVEVCRVVDTVLIDQEMVYAPRQSNDRLLLGLKGSPQRIRTRLLRQRSVEARREKARRGELLIVSPVGYRKANFASRRIPIDASRKPYGWCSRSSASWVVSGRPCCGSSSTGWNFR